MQVSISDWTVIGLYVLVLVGITIWHTRTQSDTAEFLLAGRRLTLPVFIATLVSTFYGGILGICEMVGYNGLVTWLMQGLFWYIVYLAFALFLAKRIGNMPFYTIPDILEDRFGKKTAFVGGIFTFIMVNPAPYLFSLGWFLHYFLEIDLALAITLAMLLSIVYTLLAGFRGVVYTDSFQFVCMFAAFIILFIATINTFGDWSYLQANLSQTKVTGYKDHLALTGNLSWGEIFVWGGIACWVLVDPNFYQRCFAAKSPATAQKGIFICIALWCIFDICAIGSALYAFAARNAEIIAFDDSRAAYLALAEHVLHSPLKGLLVVGILGTIMSTTDSFLFVAAVNISRDYYWRFANRNVDDRQVVTVTRIAIVFTGILAALLAVLFKSVVDLWYTLGTIGLSGLLIPTLHAFFGKSSRNWSILATMLLGATTATGWVVYGIVQGSLKSPSYPWTIQPLYPGLLMAAIVYVLGGALEKIQKN